MPPDEVTLLKLLWHPDGIEGEMVKPTAFRRTDLSGKPGDFVSVDRCDRAERGLMEAMASKQHAKANGKDIIRTEAFIGRLVCGSVRAQALNGTPLFAVSPHPETWNASHCGISCLKPPGRGDMDEVRGKLARLASPAVTFETAYKT